MRAASAVLIYFQLHFALKFEYKHDILRFSIEFEISMWYNFLKLYRRGVFLMKKGKGLISEFKAFVLRGNVIDLAVGVIIGGAFQAIVNSLVNDIVMPLVGIITGGIDFSSRVWQVGDATVTWGNFVTAVLNFLIMAVVIFAFIKILNAITDKAKPKKDEPAAAPATKVCPYCCSEIDIKAVKCPHCTSDVE